MNFGDTRHLLSKIYKVEDVFFTPTSCDSIPDEDQELLKGIKSLLKREFYFSVGYAYKITFNLQTQILSDSNLDLNAEFCWNRHALNLFNNLDPSIQDQFSNIPKIHLIQGFATFSTVNIDNKVFNYVLISRRSQNRAGPRLLKRGINTQGHVANYVETEQIIYNDDIISSFIQIRGSVPLKWKQSLTLQWDPRIEIKDCNHHDISKFYFDKHLEKYERLTIVNLLKISGNERDLTKMYGDILSNYEKTKINYIHFDMHKICGQEAFSKIHLLSDMIGRVIDEDSVFIMNKNGDILSKQTGIIRTNCKDNLDRTNLAQTYLASKAFNLQISNTNKEYTFRDIDAIRFSWADNGDALSLFYTGTPSLKGEQTRHGKGSLYSLWRDFKSSTLRYYLNNFEDGMYQDIINVFLGKSSLKVKETKNIGSISRLVSFIFHMFKPGYNSTDSLFGYIRAFVWSTYVFTTWKILNLDKNAIVLYPKLVKLNKLKEE